MRVVLETNVLLCGLMSPGGAPGRIVAAKADALITADSDLLALREHYPIHTPSEFVRKL